MKKLTPETHALLEVALHTYEMQCLTAFKDAMRRGDRPTAEHYSRRVSQTMHARQEIGL